jgi:hypothetical protein
MRYVLLYSIRMLQSSPKAALTDTLGFQADFQDLAEYLSG